MEAGRADLRRLRKSVVAMALAVAGGMVGAEATVVPSGYPGRKLQQACQTIAANTEQKKLRNPLPKYSDHYYYVQKFNSCLNTLLTPPYIYLYSGSSYNGVLARDKEGTAVILAQFPSSGGLGTFGLTPSAIKTIALPNSLASWPEDALDGCTALESIFTFGPEVRVPFITVVRTHFNDCTRLAHVQIPSTVEVGDGEFSGSGSVFPHSLQSITFPASTRSIGCAAFCYCDQLVSADLSRCENLTTLVKIRDNESSKTFAYCYSLSSFNCAGCKSLQSTEWDFLAYCPKLTSIDLSGCTRLQTLAIATFFTAPTGGPRLFFVATLPPSLQAIKHYAFAHSAGTPPGPITLIWTGRTTRPEVVAEDRPTAGISYRAFGDSKTLDDLVSAGSVTEIFVP